MPHSTTLWGPSERSLIASLRSGRSSGGSQHQGTLNLKRYHQQRRQGYEGTWTPPKGITPPLSLLTFIEETWPILEPAVPFVRSWHLPVLTEHLEAATFGRLHDLLINVPPGTTKSLTVSVFWPAWAWTFAPWLRFLTVSYDARLATRDAVRTRDLMKTSLYQGMVREDVRWDFASDQNVKGYYKNTRTGWRLAIPMVGGATGEHAHFLSVDDPHNVTRAESEADRLEVLKAWRETFPSRVLSGGARVVVAQRVHEEDLSHDWKQREPKIHHIDLAMEYEPPRSEEGHPLPEPVCPIIRRPHDPRRDQGELLSPHRFSALYVQKKKLELGAYGYAAQYQQQPTPREGAILNTTKFRLLPVGYTRAGKIRVQYYDTGFSGNPAADPTAGVTWDVDLDNEHFYLTHLFHGVYNGVAADAAPETPTDLDRAMAAHIKATRPDLVGVEKAAFRQKAVEDLIRRVQRLLAEDGIILPMEAVEVDTDKVTRAYVLQGRLNADQVFADMTLPAWTAYATELAKFPLSAHDDYVDASAGGMTMALVHAARIKKNREIAEAVRKTIPGTYPYVGTRVEPDPEERTAWMHQGKQQPLTVDDLLKQTGRR